MSVATTIDFEKLDKNKLIELFEDILTVADTIDCRVQGWGVEPNLDNLSSLCFFNSLHNFHAIQLLLKKKYYSQSGVILRQNLEISFFLEALKQNSSSVIEALFEDKNKSFRSIKGFMDENEMLHDDNAFHVLYADLVDGINPKSKGVNVKNISESARLKELYLLYKILSNEYVHVTLESIFSPLNFSDECKARSKFAVLMYFSCHVLLFSILCYAEIGQKEALIKSLKPMGKRLVDIKSEAEILVDEWLKAYTGPVK